MPINPLRSEVWLIDLGIVGKVRPALVLSVPADDTDRALVTLAPHTTSVRGTRFEIAVPVSFLQKGAFDVHNLLTIPHAKMIRRLGALPSTQMALIEIGLKLWLGL